MLSAPLGTSSDGEGVDPAAVQDYFVRHGRYTAGVAARYARSILTAETTHAHLATGFPIGARLASAPVIRLAGAKPMELGHAATADGRWRLYAFAGAGDIAAPGSRLHALCGFLQTSPASSIRKFAPRGADIDAVIDLRVIFQQAHRELAVEKMPPLLAPAKGRYGLRDYEKMFCPDLKSGVDIFDLRGVDRRGGCVVVVRPDQYVAHILPLDDFEALGAFFDAFMIAA